VEPSGQRTSFFVRHLGEFFNSGDVVEPWRTSTHTVENRAIRVTTISKRVLPAFFVRAAGTDVLIGADCWVVSHRSSTLSAINRSLDSGRILTPTARPGRRQFLTMCASRDQPLLGTWVVPGSIPTTKTTPRCVSCSLRPFHPPALFCEPETCGCDGTSAREGERERERVEK
jgi:hypothetical protein